MKKSFVFAFQILFLICFVGNSWGNSTETLNLDFESEDISLWVRQDILPSSNATWAITTDGWNGTKGLYANTIDCWPCTQDISFLINEKSVIKPEGIYTITAKVKNTGYPSWNRPNGVVFSSSMDDMSGYLALLEHNSYLTLHRYDSSGYHALIYRTPINSVQTNIWYNWVINYDPTNAFTKFEVYDLNGVLKGSIETYDTPYIDDGVGFNVYRGAAYFDDLVVSKELIYAEPDLKIDPAEMTYDFGNVEVSRPSMMYLAVQNEGANELILENIAMKYPITDDPFTYSLPSELPITIAPGEHVEIEVTYAPTTTLFFTQSNKLVIVSNDPDESVVEFTFYGRGVLAEEPSAAVSDIQYFIDYSINHGTLVPEGNGSSAEKRLNALKNMIESAGDLIDDENIQGACDQFQSIYKKVDGLPKPPDFVSGPATTGVATGLTVIMQNLGCD